MADLADAIALLDGEQRLDVLPALKILVDNQVLSLLANVNKNQLVDQRMDSDDEAALLKEIRELRQTNRVLLGLEESARQLTEGI